MHGVNDYSWCLFISSAAGRKRERERERERSNSSRKVSCSSGQKYSLSLSVIEMVFHLDHLTARRGKSERKRSTNEFKPYKCATSVIFIWHKSLSHEELLNLLFFLLPLSLSLSLALMLCHLVSSVCTQAAHTASGHSTQPHVFD